MKKQIAVLCFILLAGFACKKPLKEYTLYGYVLDDQTGDPVPNARIHLQITYGTAMYGSSINGSSAETVSDANGHYQMIIEDANRYREKAKDYNFSIFAADIQVYEHDTIVRPEYPGNRMRNLDLEVPISGAYSITLHNAAPFDQNDEIRSIYFNTLYTNNSYYLINGNVPITGTNVNQTLKGRVKHGRNILHYTVKKNNISTEHADTLMIPRVPDTLHYQLNY